MEMTFDNIMLGIVILCIVTGIPLLIYVIYRYYNERKERIKRILTETKPIEVNLHDVLIYEYSKDGLHLSDEGYKIVTKKLKSVLETK